MLTSDLFSIENLLQVNTEKRFWNWTYHALVPELFAHAWYNGNDPLGLRLFLDDRNNLKIGYAVLRQVRIEPSKLLLSVIRFFFFI